MKNDFRTRDHQLETFAAHLLDKNRDLHFAACINLEGPGEFGIADL